MLTTREPVAAGTTAAILAGVGISSAKAPAPRHAAIDRELRLSISDGFARQTWIYPDRIFTETRDTLTFQEGEVLRIVVMNDGPGVRVVSLGSIMLRVPGGEMRATLIAIDKAEAFQITVLGQPMITRPAKVRANFGKRARVA
jgi:hypothetical protein